MAVPSPKWRPRASVSWAAVFSLLGYLLAALVGAPGWRFFFALLSAAFLLVLGWRALAPWRERLLWRLRDQLFVAYAFIGLIPLLLLLLMGSVGAWTLYSNLAVSLVTDRLEKLQHDLEDVSSDLASAIAVAGALEEKRRPEVITRILHSHAVAARQRLAGVEIRLLEPPRAKKDDIPAWLYDQQFSGIVVGEGADLVSYVPVHLKRTSVAVVSVYHLDAQGLPALSRGLGRVALAVSEEQKVTVTVEPGRGVRSSGLRFIADAGSVPPPLAWWDRATQGFSTQPAHRRDTGKAGQPLVLIVESRVSVLHRVLTSRLGEFSGIPRLILTVFGVLFLLLQLRALWIGGKLTRRITTAVNDLQVATEQVQAANFSHRIPIRGRDQLSGLAQAFNSMAASIERLIEESKERQRLENELEVARQVQEQLFPREAPQLATLQLVGVCQPARVVSGDYYDYGLLAPGKLVFAIGDISGKGISAALLMATIQAALRSQVTAARLRADGADLSPAALVARLNRQLFETTSSEKYASLFFAIYSEADRTLTYTNAGHLAPIVLRDGQVERLEVGGAVVGVFGDARYEEARVRLGPGSVLVAFTDGLTEAENAYGEELSMERLLRVVRAHPPGPPDRLAQALLDEVRHWTPAREPADDMTLLVAQAY